MKYDIIFTTLFYHNPFMVVPWVEYHKKIGVDHFLLYYDGLLGDLSKKYPDVYEKILEYCDEDIVTLIEWDIHDSNSWRNNLNDELNVVDIENRLWERHRYHQFHDTLLKYGHHTKWVGNFDLDEFFIMEKYCSIKEFLSEYEKEEVSHLRMKNNWALLDGMSSLDYKKFNIEDFLKCDTYVQKSIDQNGEIFSFSTSEGKYIYNPRKVIELSNHHVEKYEGEIIYLDESEASYLHYKREWDENDDSNLRRDYMIKWPTGHKNVWGHHISDSNYDIDEYIFGKWALLNIDGDIIINNRIRDLIRGSIK